MFQRDGLVYVFVRGYLPALVGQRAVARGAGVSRVGRDAASSSSPPGNLTDYPTIEADLRADCERFDVKDIVIERYGALHLAANLAAAGLPARVESKNAKVFTAAGEGPRSAHQGAAAAAYRQLVSDLAGLERLRRAAPGWLAAADEGRRRCRRTRSTRSTRSCWRCSAMLATPTTPAYEPRHLFPGGVMAER